MLVFILASCKDEDSTLEPTLNTDLTDQLTLDEFDLGSQFIADGIGVVTLASCEDGDTAEFYTEGQVIRLRFLGVDTPEASHYYEPWGVQATDFACERLYNAETIVLESDPSTERRDNYQRYLGFVWYDGRLLNLELIEQAYSTASGFGTLKYGDLMQQAQTHATRTGKRIYGETDPYFTDAGRGDGIDVMIESLVNYTDDFLLKRVNISGVVTRILGDQAFLQDGDYGVFVYAGHGRGNPDRLAVGNEVYIVDAQFYRDVRRYGGNFLTDVNAQRNPAKTGTIDVLNQNVIIEPRITQISALDKLHVHTLLKINNLTIIEFKTVLSSDMNNSEIIVVEDAEGNRLMIEQSHRVYTAMRYDFSTLTVGMRVNVVGPLIESEQGYKLLLTDNQDLEIVD